jgi:hypothetical protein
MQGLNIVSPLQLFSTKECLLQMMSSHAHNILCFVAFSCIKFFKHINGTQHRRQTAQAVNPFPLSDVRCKQSLLKSQKLVFCSCSSDSTSYLLTTNISPYFPIFLVTYVKCGITWQNGSYYRVQQNVSHSLDGDVNEECGR